MLLKVGWFLYYPCGFKTCQQIIRSRLKIGDCTSVQVRQNKARVDRAGLGVPLVYMPIHEQRKVACKATRPACAGDKINFEMASSDLTQVNLTYYFKQED